MDTAIMRPDMDGNIAWIWFAPNTLHIQSYESLNDLYEEQRRLNYTDLSFDLKKGDIIKIIYDDNMNYIYKNDKFLFKATSIIEVRIKYFDDGEIANYFISDHTLNVFFEDITKQIQRIK